MRSKPSPGWPFAPVNDQPFRARIVEALLATEGVTLTREAAEALADRITDRAADLITKPSKDGIVTIRPDHLAWRDVGGQRVRLLRTYPTFNVPSPHNLRIEHRWWAPGAPARPWPQPILDKSGRPTAALVTEFDSIDDVMATFEWAIDELRRVNSDAIRGYSLISDLARNGQEEPGLAVIHKITWTDPEGTPRHHFVLANLLGNSRALCRLDLLGVPWDEAALGLRPSTLRADRAAAGVDDEVRDDPTAAWNALMAVYETVKEAKDAGEPAPEGYDKVLKVDLDAAAQVASAPCWVVVGVTDPARTLDLVQRLNLRDHLRGNQDLDPAAKFLAMGAAVIDRYVEDGRVTPEDGLALAGHVAPDALAPGRSRYEAEAVRRGRLLELLFPTNRADRELVTSALGQPLSKTSIRTQHAELRARVFTALVSRGGVNPRVGDVFTVAEVKHGLDVSGRSVRDLARAAADDPGGPEADELLNYHAPVMLAEAGLHEAFRGSSAAARQATNVRKALGVDRRRAIGLINEILDADADHRDVHQVDDYGLVLDEVADLSWFNDAFPRKGVRSKTEPPPRTPDQQLQDATAQAMALVDVDLKEAIGDLGELVDTILTVGTKHQLHIDSDWVMTFSRKAGRLRNALAAVNRMDDLIDLIADEPDSDAGEPDAELELDAETED